MYESNDLLSVWIHETVCEDSMAIGVCQCLNTGQDALHGKGHRVVNPINKSKLQGVIHRYRCTSCGRDVPKEHVIKGHGK